MRAWLVERITDEGEMRLADIPAPEPGPGQSLIKVEAAGLNFLDTLQLRGKYQVKPPLPFTPGVEVAGRVIKAGAGSRFTEGERLCGTVPTGGFAEQAVVADGNAIRLPDGVPAAESVGMVTIYPTSHVALKNRAGIKPGDTVLVHAGAGGVGSAAVQLAKAWGARVIATAGGEEKAQLCRDIGADVAIDYKAGDWVEAVRKETDGRGCDIIYDPVGDAIGEQSVRVLAWGGRLLIVGFAGGRIPQLPANRFLLKNASAVGVYWGEWKKNHPDLAEEVFADLFRMYEAGQIKPIIGERFPLSEAPAALEALGGRKSVGKVVLIP